MGVTLPPKKQLLVRVTAVYFSLARPLVIKRLVALKLKIDCYCALLPFRHIYPVATNALLVFGLLNMTTIIISNNKNF